MLTSVWSISVMRSVFLSGTLLALGVSAAVLPAKKPEKPCPLQISTTGKDTGVISFTTIDEAKTMGSFICARKDKLLKAPQILNIYVNGKSVYESDIGKQLSIRVNCNKETGIWQYQGRNVQDVECEHIMQK